MQRKKLYTFGTALLVVGMLLGLQIGSAVSGDTTFQALQKLQNAFQIISQTYVDPVDSAELAEGAIEGMLKDLDPHSVYISAERMRAVNEDFNASFEGIGIAYELISGPEGRDTLAVLNVISGGPSDQVGLLSGDRIVAIDDSSAIGFENEDVQKALKGPRGTQVKVAVRRPGLPTPLTFTITRDRIPLNTVEAAYMIDERTGYIKLDRFARTTYAEVNEALRTLKARGMERLIFDLRGNAGGFMDMAIRVSDEFLKEGQTIVSARSRHVEFNQDSRAEPGGQFEDRPVIVLVDEHSASASEIVAGALQDHDRALIVGRRTFGKGLVQKQYTLNDGSAIRVTISRYYTPSGRLIQTAYEEGHKEDYYAAKQKLVRQDASLSVKDILASVPDSLKYKTDGGRIVIGGGGILPDYFVYPDSLSPFVQAVLAQGADRSFAREWLDQHGADFHARYDGQFERFRRAFDVDAAMMQAFLAHVGQRGVKLVDGPSDPEKSVFSRAAFEADRALLATVIKGRIAARAFGSEAWYPVYHQSDRMLQEAMKLWQPATDLVAAYQQR